VSHVVESSRDAVARRDPQTAIGSWSNTMTVDGYDEPVTLRQSSPSPTTHRGRLRRDIGQSRRGINVPVTYTAAYTMFGLRARWCRRCRAMPARSPRSRDGAARIDPECTAPGGSDEPPYHGQMLPDVAFGCLRQALPEKVRPRYVLLVELDHGRGAPRPKTISSRPS